MDNLFSKVAQKIGIVPTNTFYRTYPTIYKCVAILHAIINFSVSSYPVVYLIENDCAGERPTLCVFIMIISVSYGSVVSLSILLKSVFYPEYYIGMKQQFSDIDTILNDNDITIEHRYGYIGIVIFHIFFVAYVIFVYFLFFQSYPLVYNILSNWTIYNMGMEIIIPLKILEQIRLRLKYMNVMINKLNTTKLNTGARASIGYKFDFDISSKTYKKREVIILQILSVQHKIAKIIYNFNVLYGYTILMLSVSFVFEFLSVALRLFIKFHVMVLLDLLDAGVHLVRYSIT